MGQERLGPSYFAIPLVLGPLNSLVWYVPSLRYTRGLGWCMHCGAEVTESSTNKQHYLLLPKRLRSAGDPEVKQTSKSTAKCACFSHVCASSIYMRACTLFCSQIPPLTTESSCSCPSLVQVLCALCIHAFSSFSLLDMRKV